MTSIRILGRGSPWALLAAMIVALLLRAVYLGSMSVWSDEAVSLTVARQATIPAMLSELKRLDAACAPLHTTLLRAWMRMFGTSDTSVRAFSVACSLASLAILYHIALRLFGSRVAGWTVLLQAVNPLDIYHAREARMYALLAMLTCTAWAWLLSFRDSAGMMRCLGYALILALLVYAHPLGMLMVAALALGYLSERSRTRLAPTRWLAIQFGMMALIVPWLPRYLDHPPQFLTPRIAASHLFEWPESFTAGRAEAVWLGAGLIAWGLLATCRRRSQDTMGVNPAMLPRQSAEAPRLVLIWLLAPPALLLVLSWLKAPIFGPRRYLLFVGPAYLMLLATGLSALPRIARLAVGGLFLAMAVTSLEARVYQTIHHRDDWRGLAEFIRERNPNALIAFDGPDMPGRRLCLAYYLNPVNASRYVQTHIRTTRQIDPNVSNPVWIVRDPIADRSNMEVPATDVRSKPEDQSWTLGAFGLALRDAPRTFPAGVSASRDRSRF